MIFLLKSGSQISCGVANLNVNFIIFFSAVMGSHVIDKETETDRWDANMQHRLLETGSHNK